MRRSFGWLAVVAGLLAVAFLLLRTPDIPAEDLRAKYASPQSQFLALSPGFVVHVRDEGPRDAPVLLLAHGSNASLHTWEPWVARLSERYRVVTLDLQGHGLTGPIPSGCYTRECMVTTIEAVRQRLAIERFAIGGSSMGGAVAWTYALEHSERVKALVLVASSGAPRAGGGTDPIGFRLARMPLIRELAVVVTPRALIERSLAQSVSVASAASAEAVDRYWELLRYPGNRRATLQRFPSEPATKERLAPLQRLPVLLLWGTEDRLLAVAEARFFADAMPQAKLIAYPGIGHLPQEETPDRSAADVAAFLDDVGVGG